MQFLFPGFLAGLMAVGLPIVVHLLQLRRPQRISFTNTGFIKEVELITTRQRRVQQWVVLLLRVLAVVCLVLAFCQPFIPAQEGGSTSAGDVAVIVDTTPSMRAQGSKGLLIDEAVAGARALGQVRSVGSRFRLLNESAGQLTAGAFESKLLDLRASARGTGIAARVAEELSNASAGPVYLFSDFQKSGLRDAFFEQLGSREVVLVPQVARATGNVHVDSVWVDDAFVRAGTPTTLRLRLRNGGRERVVDCPVKVLLEGQQVAAFRATVEANKATIAAVQVQVSANKLALGRVVTGDAPVTFDNEFYFTLQPAAAIRVVEIGEGEPVAQQAYGNEPLFNYSFAKARQLNYAQLQRANLVLLREVARVDAGLREALAGVVRRGGNVVVVPSAEAGGRESYQKLFRELGLGTAQWETASVSGPELREVAMPNRQDPFFRDVFGAQPRQVAMPRVAPVLRWGRTGTDVLRLRDGDSYLAGFESGAGRTYVFSAPFQKNYSDFVSHALFVPVLYRLAMLSYRNDQSPAYRLTQPTLALAVPTALGGGPKEASFRLVKDSLTLIPGQRVQGRELRFDLPAGMDDPGFYELRRADGQLVTTLAFNSDRAESDLAAYSPTELRELVKGKPNVRVLEPGTSPEAALIRDGAERTGRPLWRYFLVGALACLLAEALVLRFGRQAAPAGSRVVASA